MKVERDQRQFTKPTEVAIAFNRHFVSIGPKLAAQSSEHENFKKYLSSNKSTFVLQHTSRKVVQKHVKHL